MARCCCGPTTSVEGGLTCADVPNCIGVEANQGIGGGKVTITGSGTPADPFIWDLNCPAIAACLADGVTTVVSQDGKLSAVGGGDGGNFSCAALQDCIDNDTIALNLDGKLTATVTAPGFKCSDLTDCIDGATIAFNGDGKLSAVVPPAPPPFQCSDLDSCIDDDTIKRLADGKLHVNCAALYEHCNFQPQLEPASGSGITITEPADPTSGNAVIGIDGAALTANQVAPHLSVLLSPFAEDGVNPNPITLDGSGLLTAAVTPDSPPSPLNLPIVAADSTTIDFTGDGLPASPLTGEVKLSTFTGQRTTVRSDGLYTPPVSIADTSTVDMTGQGSADNPLKADVKISGNPGQTLSSDGDGLYHPGTHVAAGDGIEVSGNPVDGYTVSAVATVAGQRFIVADNAIVQAALTTSSEAVFNEGVPDSSGAFAFNGTDTLTVTETGLYLITVNAISQATAGIGDRSVTLTFGSPASSWRLADEADLAAGKTWADSSSYLAQLTAGTTVKVTLGKPVTLSPVTWSVRLAVARLG